MEQRLSIKRAFNRLTTTLNSLGVYVRVVTSWSLGSIAGLGAKKLFVTFMLTQEASIAGTTGNLWIIVLCGVLSAVLIEGILAKR